MTVESRWLPRLKTCRGPAEFVGKALVLFAAASLKRRERRPEGVKLDYDTDSRKTHITDWDTYVLGPDDTDFTLSNGAVTVGRLRDARHFVLDRLTTLVQQSNGSTIVELGCGNGRNLLYLKKEFPHMRCVGFDFAPASVTIAREASEKFGHPIEVYEADVSKPIDYAKHNLDQVALAYTVLVMEQMPRIYVGAVDNLLALNPKTVAMYEPVVELNPIGIRGLAARFRSIGMDRLRGLSKTVRDIASRGKWKIDSIRATGHADNPLNEVCEIILSRRA